MEEPVIVITRQRLYMQQYQFLKWEGGGMDWRSSGLDYTFDLLKKSLVELQRDFRRLWAYSGCEQGVWERRGSIRYSARSAKHRTPSLGVKKLLKSFQFVKQTRQEICQGKLRLTQDWIDYGRLGAPKGMVFDIALSLKAATRITIRAKHALIKEGQACKNTCKHDRRFIE